ncbi:MAG: hypothetical protein U1E76_13980 [Planctomycetota bacterium]
MTAADRAADDLRVAKRSRRRSRALAAVGDGERPLPALSLERLPSAAPSGATAELLRAIFERHLCIYFNDQFPGGRHVAFGLLRRSSFRTIGKADVSQRTILLHPDLLQPQWQLVLELVLYHEMIHFAVLRHNREFKRRERRFAGFAEARRQERAFFRWLESRQLEAARRFAYRCPRCATRYLYRSRRGHLYSCGRCARGYDPELRLIAAE